MVEKLFHAGASLILCVVFALASLRSGDRRSAIFIGVILLGLLSNAFATGALAGVFGRYQGRAIWLLPFAAVVTGFVVVRDRTVTARSR